VLIKACLRGVPIDLAVERMVADNDVQRSNGLECVAEEAAKLCL